MAGQHPKPSAQPAPSAPAPDSIPKLPKTIFNTEKKSGDGGGAKDTQRRG